MAFAAEAVAILAIGCVAGLKGLQKVRKGVGYALVRMLCMTHRDFLIQKHIFNTNTMLQQSSPQFQSRVGSHSRLTKSFYV